MYHFLRPQDLGLPLHSKPSSICGEILNPEGSADGVKRTVVGGVICIQNTFYAMTSRHAHVNATHAYLVQYASHRLDWALCEIAPSLVVPNLDLSLPLLYYAQEEELTPGAVNVLDGNGPHRGYLNDDLDTSISGSSWEVKVRNVIMDGGVKCNFSMGAWVVRGQTVFGYVVHTAPTKDKRKCCHMIPIAQAFADIERKVGQKIIFGQELHNMMPKN